MLTFLLTLPNDKHFLIENGQKRHFSSLEQLFPDEQNRQIVDKGGEKWWRGNGAAGRGNWKAERRDVTTLQSTHHLPGFPQLTVMIHLVLTSLVILLCSVLVLVQVPIFLGVLSGVKLRWFIRLIFGISSPNRSAYSDLTKLAAPG